MTDTDRLDAPHGFQFNEDDPITDDIPSPSLAAPGCSFTVLLLPALHSKDGAS